MSRNKLTSLAGFLLITLLVSACGAIKPGTNGKSSKYFETFYAGSGGGTQYFIKPMDFEADGKQTVLIDFTLRDIDFANDQTTVNYTITSNEQLGTDQAITALDATGKILFSTTGAERLFQERTKTGYLARFTAKAPNVAVAEAFKKGDFSLVAQPEAGERIEFSSTNRTQNILPDVYRNLFSLY